MKIFQLSIVLMRGDQAENDEGKGMAARQDIMIDFDKMSGDPIEVLQSAISTFDLKGIYEAAMSQDGTYDFPLDGEPEH